MSCLIYHEKIVIFLFKYGEIWWNFERDNSTLTGGSRKIHITVDKLFKGHRK